MLGCEALKAATASFSTLTSSGASPVPRQQYQRIVTGAPATALGDGAAAEAATDGAAADALAGAAADGLACPPPHAPTTSIALVSRETHRIPCFMSCPPCSSLRPAPSGRRTALPHGCRRSQEAGCTSDEL